jgi:hypothetical protein
MLLDIIALINRDVTDELVRVLMVSFLMQVLAYHHISRDWLIELTTLSVSFLKWVPRNSGALHRRLLLTTHTDKLHREVPDALKQVASDNFNIVLKIKAIADSEVPGVIDRVTAALDNLQPDVSALLQASELQVPLSELQVTIANLLESSDRLRQTLGDREAELDSVGRQRLAAEAKQSQAILDLETELARQHRSFDELQRALEEQRTANKTKQTRIADLEAQRAALQAELTRQTDWQRAVMQLVAAAPGGSTPPAAGPSGAGPSGAGPSGAGPSGAGPSGAGPSGAGPSGAGPSGAGPSGAAGKRPRASKRRPYKPYKPYIDDREKLCIGFSIKKGQPCTQRRQRGSEYCYYHDPEKAKKIEEVDLVSDSEEDDEEDDDSEDYEGD